MSGQHHHGPAGQHTCYKHGGGTAWAVAFSLIVNIVLTALKWAAFLITWSPSLFGEAAHSTADTMNPLLLWFGNRRSQRPSCDQHPFGHGREAFFWSLMAAQMMFMVGCVATAYHGLQSLVTGHVPELSWLAGGIMIFALFAEGLSLFFAWRNVKKSGETTTIGDAARSKNPIILALILENSVDIVGVLLALCGYGLFVVTGQAYWDGIFSLAIAALLATSSIFLIRRNMSLITGETADEEMTERIRDTLQEIPTVCEVEQLVATMIGPEEVKCRLVVRLNRAALVQDFLDTPQKPWRNEDTILWTVSRLQQEKRVLIGALKEKVHEVVLVDIDCH